MKQGLNGYEVTIVEAGYAEQEGYGVMRHGQKFTIRLKNKRGRRCDATVTVNGKLVGTFRLNAYGEERLERSPHGTGHLTFYEANTQEAVIVGQPDIDRGDWGLVSVVFKPEHERRSEMVYRSATRGGHVEKRSTRDIGLGLASMGAKGLSAGIVGESGHSDQQFVSVGAIEYAPRSEWVTIHIRLVSDRRRDDSPRPLGTASNSAPIPPAL